MRIASALTLIAAAAASFSASAAPASTNVDASMTSVPVSAHSDYRLSPTEMAGLHGSYALEDGRTLHVSGHGQHLYADIDGNRTEIVPVARARFASADDSVRLVFNSSEAPTEVKVSTVVR